MSHTLVLAAAGVAAALAIPSLATAATYNTLDGSKPIIIAHRGASGYLPEHTLEAYKRAIELGADYIEPDLVMTKDGILVARHEPVMGGTTDVSTRAEFMNRRRSGVIDGVRYDNEYFVEDFTLAELKTLRAIQTRGRDKSNDGLFEVPTLDEVIALAKSESLRTGRNIGIYPELKHSTYMKDVSKSLGLGATYFEDKLVQTLHDAYGNSRSAPVFIQSFEVGNLQYLNTRTDIRLVQLVDADDVRPDGSMSLVDPYRQPFDVASSGGKLTFADLVSEVGLNFVKTYADGIGPWKPYLVTTVADGRDRNGDGVITINDRKVLGSTGVIENAHEAGLFVHTWTFRNDASGYGFTDPRAEMSFYLKLGVDGVFTDFPDTGVAALAAIPEPGTYAMMLLGLAGVAAVARRRRA